jgi:hypothetical protein
MLKTIREAALSEIEVIDRQIEGKA